MAALALLIVTPALALMLAVLSQGVAAGAGVDPARHAGPYLAWLAVPGVISPPEPGTAKKPGYGRLTGGWI